MRRREASMIRRASRAMTATAVLCAGACAGGAADAAAPREQRTSPAASVPSASDGGCGFALTRSGTGFPEVRGRSADARLWMLLFAETVPPPPRDTVKIVIRMTGTGGLRLWAEGPGVERLEPEGSTSHGSSNWDRRGDEWGTYWTFPRAGCWRIHAERDRASGTLELLVKP